MPRKELIGPHKLRPERSSFETRYGGVKVHVTPYQRQKWELVFQLLKTPSGSLVTPCLKWSNERRSWLLLSSTLEEWKLATPLWQKCSNSSSIRIRICMSTSPRVAWIGWYTCHARPRKAIELRTGQIKLRDVQ